MDSSITRIKSYKDLIVWQKSFCLCLLVYQLTSKFPKSEIYGLISQLRRAAVSLVSNIAEGFERGRKLEYIQFLRIAAGSAAELETQIMLAGKLGFLSEQGCSELLNDLKVIQKMLNALIKRIKDWSS